MIFLQKALEILSHIWLNLIQMLLLVAVETIFAINKFSNMSNFHYVSTAGGAFLEYLSGSTLPSIEALDVK